MKSIIASMRANGQLDESILDLLNEDPPENGIDHQDKTMMMNTRMTDRQPKETGPAMYKFYFLTADSSLT